MNKKSKSSSSLKLVVRGTRGSHPVSGKQYLKYGGNTTCYEVRAGECLIIIDAGTGIINLGKDIMQSYTASGTDQQPHKPIEAILLFTHTHVDHIMGLPFFTPIYFGNTILYIYGPDVFNCKFEEAVNCLLNPPLFPITVDDMSSLKLFRAISQSESIFWSEEKGIPLVLNNFREIERIHDAEKRYPVRICCMKNYAHPVNGSMIYKIIYNNKSIVIATDTEGYVGGDTRLAHFAEKADLLLHDAGYTSDIYSSKDQCKQGYGHSTMEMAVGVAQNAQVKQLALIHHEPAYDDTIIAKTENKARKLFKNTVAAYEGQVFEL